MKSVKSASSHGLIAMCLGLLVLLSASPCLSHDGQRKAAHGDNIHRGYTAYLQFLLDSAVTEALPGVALRIKGRDIDFHGVAGVANLYTAETLTTAHAMYAASLGKTFTATIALQLCEEGRLDLETPIAHWLPREITERIASAGRLTLRHLLSHTSGLVDYMNDEKAWRIDFARDPARTWTHRDVLAYLYDRPLLFEPGSDFHYSNSNYVLAGLIIELILEQPMHVIVRNRILSPLGLERTIHGQHAVSGVNRAHGYINRRGRAFDTFPWYSHYGLADSGIYATTDDLARFIESLFGSDKLLSDAMRYEMTRASGSGKPRSDYGLGIYIQQNPWGWGRRWYAHDGVDPGYQADMMYLPKYELTIVLAANASMGRASAIYNQLLEAVIDVTLQSVRQRN